MADGSWNKITGAERVTSTVRGDAINAEDDGVKELEDMYNLPGMLTAAEADCLYSLGKFNQCVGVIVEFGSWKGKSIVVLVRGAAKVHSEKIYAIDPHRILPKEGYLEDTEATFRENIKEAGVLDQVVPMVMTSEEAARG